MSAPVEAVLGCINRPQSYHRRMANVVHQPRMKISLALLIASLALSCAPQKETARSKASLEVSHSWTSPGEVRAVTELVQAYEGAGGRWRNFSVAGFQNVDALVLSRIVGGQAPGAYVVVAGPYLDDLANHGLLTPIDDVARKYDWKSKLPPELFDSLSVRNHVYAAPLNVHVNNWMFSSTDALRRAGIRSMPSTWPQTFEDLERLKRAGLVPLAFGGQPWQEQYVFDSILLSKGGPQFYLRVYQKRDPSAVRSPVFREALDIFGRLRGYVDPGSPGRNWNDATAMLISGKAGFQIMGDWAQAEFRRAGLKPDLDYGCSLDVMGGGASYSSDAFVFPQAGAAARPAQLLLAQVTTRPAVQARFAERLGALPAFGDAKPDSAAVCDRRAEQTMATSGKSAPSSSVLLAPDVHGDLEDVISEYWARGVSEKVFIDRFATILATAT
jgi:glucose/mannose transport system substrate-binding protein